MDDGIIIDGFIEPPIIIDDGTVPELLIDDDWGIKRVVDVWDKFEEPMFP